MPVYEYECKHCGSRFEKMQPVTAEPLSECIECGQGPLRRIFHPVGVIFKGSGWYVTDSRNSGKGASNKAESSDSSDSSDSKAESGDSSDGSDGSAAKPDADASSVAKPAE
jgi:putative FmdB family regulatory protein